MTALAALGLAAFGFAGLALSMHTHHRDLFGRPSSHRRAMMLRGAGWTALATSIALCISGFGPSIGIVSWLGLLTVAALIVAVTLTYRQGNASRRRNQKSQELGTHRK